MSFLQTTIAAMDRDSFIQQMIAELMRQKENDVETFEKTSKNAAAIFRSLCYDYPMIEDSDLISLATEIRSYAMQSASVCDEFRSKFWLHDKFLDNLVYLSTISPKATEESREKAMGILSASVFIHLAALMLSTSQAELSRLFCGPRSTDDDDDDDYYCNPKSSTNSTPSAQDPSLLLPWPELVARFRSFVLQGTSSLLTGIESEASTTLEVVRIIIDNIKVTGTCLSGVQSQSSTSAFTSLSQYFHKVGANPPTEETAMITSTTASASVSASAMTAASDEVSQYTTVMSTCRDVWLHWAFLGRDLLIQHPLLVVADAAGSEVPATAMPAGKGKPATASGSCFSALCGAILIADGVDKSSNGAASSSSAGLFPSAAECLFVMVFTGVIGSLTASTSVPSTHSLSDDRSIDFKSISSSGIDKDKDGSTNDNSNGDGNSNSEVVSGLREDQNRARIRQCLQGASSANTHPSYILHHL